MYIYIYIYIYIYMMLIYIICLYMTLRGVGFNLLPLSLWQNDG